MSTPRADRSAPTDGRKIEPDDSAHLEGGTRKLAESEVFENSDDSPLNPRNWPLWKKNAQILMIAFHSMMSTFMAAGIVPAFDEFAEDYNVSVASASYLTSFQVSRYSLSSRLPALLIYIIMLDPGSRSRSPNLEASRQFVRSIPGLFIFCTRQHGL